LSVTRDPPEVTYSVAQTLDAVWPPMLVMIKSTGNHCFRLTVAGAEMDAVQVSAGGNRAAV